MLIKFYSKGLKARHLLGELDVDRIILKWFFEKCGCGLD
jgi:hypothetical protein